MAIHSQLTGADLHEPKGIESAIAGQAYIADGGGSGAWSSPLIGVASAQNGQVLVATGTGSASWETPAEVSYVQEATPVLSAETTSTQSPTGTDAPAQVTFGSAQNGPSDPVQLLADGTIRFNEAGLYHTVASFHVGRTGASGTSYFLLTEAFNGSYTSSYITIMDGPENNTTLHLSRFIVAAAADEQEFFITRDSTGSDFGSLMGFTPTLAGLPSVASAKVSVHKMEIGSE